MNNKITSIFSKLLMVIVTIIFASPFYISFVYSVKTPTEITFTGLSLPSKLHFENYTTAIEISGFWAALKNTVITTAPTVLVLTFVCAMASYVIARNKTKWSNFIYFLFLSAILIPFQAIMLPLYVNLKNWNLLNQLGGFVLTKIGFLIAFNILIMTGFIKTVPIELEEAAQIDGAGFFKTFWQIVFPLLKPIMLTSVILNTVYTWNDFQIAMVILQKDGVRTLPLIQYFFFGEHNIELHLAFATFTLSMIPLLIIYLILQKYIINGIMTGSVKG